MLTLMDSEDELMVTFWNPNNIFQKSKKALESSQQLSEA